MGSILYEVNLAVDPTIEKEFEAWLPQHINDMLALGCFQSASFWKLRQESGARPQYVSHFILDSFQTLTEYFEHHAEKMRADGVQRFSNKMKASRRILERPDL